MQLGVESGERSRPRGRDEIPQTWGVEVQTPILDALVARGDLDYIITAPTDKDQMVGPLQAAVDAGIKVITVDTFLGDGDYVNGPVTFPISYIGSDNVEGGRISARGLAEAIGGKGNVYINRPTPTSARSKVAPSASTGDGERVSRDQGGRARRNLDDMNTAVQQTAAVLQRVPDLAGVFGTNVFSAQGAGTAVVNAGLGGQVQVVAYDATQFAIEQLRQGVVSLVLAQKPFDMGYMAVQFAAADAAGVHTCRAASRPDLRSSTRTMSTIRPSHASSTRCRASSPPHRMRRRGAPFAALLACCHDQAPPCSSS